MLSPLCLSASLLLAIAPNAFALSITNVQHTQGVFDLEKQDSIAIRYRLSEPAQVSLKLFDGRDLLIRELSSNEFLSAGDQAFDWDGRDQAGRPVPAEAYRYTLTATNTGGERVEHDVSDLTGGNKLKAQDIQWDKASGQIRYVIGAPARVLVRLGIKDYGPLLRTLVNWVPRPGGVNAEPWDGLDASGQLDLTDHPKLDITIQAFALSDNTILVGRASDTVQLIKDMSWAAQQREAKKTSEVQVANYANQPIQTRRDFQVELMLPAELPKTAEGLPIISEITPISLTAGAELQPSIVAQRFETVFFVDGQFAFESEKGYLPLTWRWDPQGSNPGVHYITVNVLGYEGNFGTRTVKVMVQPSQ